MPLSSNRPTLHVKTVEQALEAMRTAHILHAHPLQSFVSVLSRLDSPYALWGDAAVQVAIFDHLTGIILEHLTSLRQQYNLPPPDRTCSDGDLKADFSKGNKELQAWSILYYRYICVDRDLSMQQIASLTHQEERTPRRRHELGLKRLTFELVAREQDARQRETHQRLRLALPVSQPPALFCSTSLVDTAVHVLTAAEPPRHLILHGPAGIGKTALALTLAHQLADSGQFEDLLWLDVTDADLTPSVLIHSIAAGLGLSHIEDVAQVLALRAYLLTHPTLLVLDQADDLFIDSEVSRSLLTTLGSAHVVLTSRRAPPPAPWCYTILVPELTREQAFAFLDHLSELHPHRQKDWTEHFDAIWNITGGNPLALQGVFDASRILPLTATLAQSEIHRLYEHVWQQLTPDEQRLWLLPLLFPAEGIPHKAAAALTGMESDRTDQALVALGGRALLNTRRERHLIFYTHSPVAKAFLAGYVREGTLSDGEPTAAFLRRVLRRRVEQLVNAPDPEAALLLLRLGETLGFSGVEQWEHAYKLAYQIMEAGAWSPWSQLISTLLVYEYDDSSVTAWLAWMRGVALRWLGELSDASGHLERTLAYYTSEGNPHQAEVMVELAVIWRYQGEWEKAQRLLLNALDLCAGFGISHGVERCLHELGQLALEKRDPDRALDWISRLEPWSIRSWGIAAQAHLLLGQLDQARQAAEHLDALLHIHHPARGRAAATLGLIYDRLGEPDAAVDYSLLATEWLERAKDMIGYARACNNLAVAYLKQPAANRRVPSQDVHRWLTKALRIQEHVGDEIGLAVTRQNLAWLSTLGPDIDSPQTAW